MDDIKGLESIAALLKRMPKEEILKLYEGMDNEFGEIESDTGTDLSGLELWESPDRELP